MTPVRAIDSMLPVAMDLRASLPALLPLAISWAERESQQVQLYGVALADPVMALARSVGVIHPERVRVASVDAMPLPEHPLLRAAATQTGLLGANTIGLTLGHSILLIAGHESPRLLSHELRHVYQYEIAGSIAAFLPVYLGQIFEFGYIDTPLEQDARSHEIAL
jgi:hypothetical protein